MVCPFSGRCGSLVVHAHIYTHIHKHTEKSCFFFNAQVVPNISNRLVLLALFPGTAQPSATCSTEKQGEPGIFSHVRWCSRKMVKICRANRLHFRVLFNWLNAQCLMCTTVRTYWTPIFAVFIIPDHHGNCFLHVPHYQTHGGNYETQFKNLAKTCVEE